MQVIRGLLFRGEQSVYVWDPWEEDPVGRVELNVWTRRIPDHGSKNKTGAL